MVAKGFLAAGYQYLNLDDCWQSYNRASNGTIVVDPVAFPHGIKPVADFVHSRGMKFGIYSSAGRYTCAGRMASLDHEEEDAARYAEWGIDYLKYDNCNYEEGRNARSRFQSMREALDRSGRDIFFSVCSWGAENTWEWAGDIGHSFRTHDDIYNDWKSVVEILSIHAKVVHLGGPGHWADPDMLEIGNGRLSVEESRTHFSLWAAMKAPLILGNSLTDMPNELYAIATHTEAIAINQDPLGVPATRIVHIPNDHDVWAGPLSNNSFVIVLVNFSEHPQPITFNVTRMCGYQGAHVQATEIWSNRVTESTYLSVFLEPHGSAMYRLTGGRLHSSSSPDEGSESLSGSTPKDDPTLPLDRRRYEAEDLSNLVLGLSRRKGCRSCSGEAHVVAIGNVNRPQTGALHFRNIVGQGVYTMTIRYLDCFSWNTCGDFFSRRWDLRVKINDGKPFWLSLKSKRNRLAADEYSLGVVLLKGNHNVIVFDNPDGYGPSIDYIDLVWRGAAERGSHDDSIKNCGRLFLGMGVLHAYSLDRLLDKHENL
ncbi:glycoside hydrolase superfamily [Dichotomocladium elegans]|nr:glycoside hydrolase superfamily [Dichotomocladium elegans]